MSVLKPCPFCGDNQLGQVQMSSMDETPPRKWTRVKCGTCGSMAPSSTWNSRASEADAKIAALEKRIAVAVKIADYLSHKDPMSVDAILGINHLKVMQRVLTMPAAELDAFLEQYPEYKPE